MSKASLYGRPAPPQPADRPRLVKAPGSLRRALALREATGEPGGRSLRHLAFNTGGIGLALAHEVAALDAATIVLGCRNLSKCELVRPVGARCVQLDLADLRSVVQFAGELPCQTRGPPRSTKLCQNGAVQAAPAPGLPGAAPRCGAGGVLKRSLRIKPLSLNSRHDPSGPYHPPAWVRPAAANLLGRVAWPHRCFSHGASHTEAPVHTV